MSGDATGARRIHVYIDMEVSCYADIPEGGDYANKTDDEIADYVSSYWAKQMRDDLVYAHAKHSHVRVECAVHSQPQITGFPSIEGGSTE